MLAVALLTALVGCNPSSADRGAAIPTATVRTEPEPTTTTNPYAVPAVIDVAYVNRVLAGLDAVNGDVVRLAYRTRTIPLEALDRLKSIYATQLMLQFAIDGLQLDMSYGFKNYRVGSGNRVSTVTQLITVQPNCVFAQVHRDFSATSTDTSAGVNPQWIAILRLDPLRDPNHFNATQWSFGYDGFAPGGARPPNPCGQ